MIAAALALSATAVDLPRYRRNDAFIFSDGRVERVLAVRRSKVTWQALSGPSYVRDRNFILPVERWRSRAGIGERRVFGAPQSLWPYVKPRTVRFRVVARTRTKPTASWRRSVTLWTCQSAKPRIVKLAFGVFRTIPFKCDRFSSVNMRPLERLEWYYSTEIGHYVRRVSIDYLRGTHLTIDLAAMLSGPAATKRRLTALARAARRGTINR